MKVMLRKNCQNHLVVYVAKKDLEEEVIKQEETDNGKIFTLANGWELAIPLLTEPNKRPRRKQRGIATLFLTFHAPQGAGNLPVILLNYLKR